MPAIPDVKVLKLTRVPTEHGMLLGLKKKKKKKNSAYYVGVLSWRGLNPIKLVYDQLSLTASWVNAVLVACSTATQNSPCSSLEVTISNSHMRTLTDEWPN